MDKKKAMDADWNHVMGIEPEQENDMKSKHTAGPWIIYTDGGRSFGIYKGLDETNAEDCIFIAEIDSRPTDANANLIAAAPDLLDVCKELSESILEEDWPELFSAIAKAEGRE